MFDVFDGFGSALVAGCLEFFLAFGPVRVLVDLTDRTLLHLHTIYLFMQYPQSSII